MRSQLVNITVKTIHEFQIWSNINFWKMKRATEFNPWKQTCSWWMLSFMYMMNQNITSVTDLYRWDIAFHGAYKMNYHLVLVFKQEAPNCPLAEHYMWWNVSWPASANSLMKNWLSLLPDFTPVTVVHHCIRHQCFILLANVCVVSKIHFAILHNFIVVRNTIQHCIRLNKQKENKHFFTHNRHLHYTWLVMLHIQVVCAHDHMEDMLWHAKGVW